MNHLELSQIINARHDEFAEKITQRLFDELEPATIARYGAYGRQKSIEDTNYHLLYLAEALAVNSTQLFSDYIQWVQVLFAGLNLSIDGLIRNLSITIEVLDQYIPQSTRPILKQFIESASLHLTNSIAPSHSHISPDNFLSNLAHEYLQAVLQANRFRASQLILDAVQSGTSVKDIYLHVFQNTQYEIGRLWQINQVNVAQEHYCTAVTQMIISQLYPYIFSREKNGKWFVATSVAGELHEIGARMVADFFEMDGWDTLFLGANTPASSVLQVVIDQKATVLGISATMTFHISRVKSLITLVRASEKCSNVKIIVGGYPFLVDPTLWKQVGADGFGRDANEAIIIANQLTGNNDNGKT